MIKLYQFPPAFNVSNPSPFCMKLETYFLIAGLPYQIKTWPDPRKAPKGKLPFIDDGDIRLADSDIIINYCQQHYPDNNPDKHLNEQQQAVARCMQRMLDEHFYWVLIYSRWSEEAGWAVLQKIFFGQLPWPTRSIVPRMIRKKVLKALDGQGLGRHQSNEIYDMGIADIKSLESLLMESPYLFGDNPSSADACAHSYLANFLHQPLQTPIQDYIKSRPRLLDYVSTIDAIHTGSVRDI